MVQNSCIPLRNEVFLRVCNVKLPRSALPVSYRVRSVGPSTNAPVDRRDLHFFASLLPPLPRFSFSFSRHGAMSDELKECPRSACSVVYILFTIISPPRVPECFARGGSGACVFPLSFSYSIPSMLLYIEDIHVYTLSLYIMYNERNEFRSRDYWKRKKECSALNDVGASQAI